MFRRVPPAVLYSIVAAVCFVTGVGIEPMFEGSAREHAAEARAMPGPVALRLGDRELLNSGAKHNDAIQAGSAQAELTPAPAPVADVAAAPASEQPDQDAEAKPSTVTGHDPETGNDFVEMKDLPEVQGEGMGSEPAASAPARDVDMIGEVGLPVPDGSTDSAPAKQATN